MATLEISVRGLHYDVERGFFLKVDCFHQIQLGTVQGQGEVGGPGGALHAQEEVVILAFNMN